MKYRWKGKSPHTHYADGVKVLIERGNLFEPTQAEIAAFGDLMEPAIILPPTVATADKTDDELDKLREKAKALGVKSTGNMGKDRLLKEITEKEAEFSEALRKEEELDRLSKEAAELGIEDVGVKDADELAAEIKAKKG
ncbi:hypothetical protein FE783_12695 [Paenibacillus mesophilus]|uniref:hypothetical protein n=1 Tax=Paenibacillus mesophilus TaxID=2582849 RepID=UPI00110D4B4D|nr:hypothetical protein [Paenibacillus mesophilus]TMV49368.1 hypothetical protein FE783_12695 [Paenibacillus mesophilus]